FSLWATHEQFARTPIISIPGEETAGEPDSAAEQLWAARLITRMNPGFALSGKVIDPREKPISGAKVQLAPQQKAFWSDQQGEFRAQGLVQGPWALTVSADGFAPVHTNVEILPGIQPMVITLQTGA